MPRKPESTTLHHPKTLLVCVEAPYNKNVNFTAYTQEFINLVNTAEIPYEDIVTIRLRSIDRATFLTKGKLEELDNRCKEQNYEQVIISETLTPLQARNLGDTLELEVIDRTELILIIFEEAAVSAEGKTQVQIAILQHQKTHLAGKGILLEQQAGVIGLRGGPGETIKERETRYIDQQISKLKKQLTQLQKTRATQRKRRLANKVPQVSLVGYTNAGKSTILNLLTKSDILAEDKLFATLDTTTRELFIDSEKIGTLSDTVGFIQQLPPKLIEAFKSTLAELEYANLLLHVVDISDQNWKHHVRIVNDILEELGVTHTQTLYVFNKADKVDADTISQDLEPYEPYVITSSLTKSGIQPLIQALKYWHKNRLLESETPAD